MKKMSKLLAICTLLALLLVPAAVMAQEPAAPEHGVIEFGFRGITGDVYGRDGEPGRLLFSNGFKPDLLNSRLNLYSDNRNSFYIPKIDTRIDSLFGSKNFVHFQSASNGVAFEGGGTLSRDQSVLITVGQYGRYKAQFRFDETPHIFSGTTRTLFTNGGRGAWTVNPALQTALYNVVSTSGVTVPTIANAVSNAVAGTLVTGVPGAQLFTQQESRKSYGGSVSVNITPDVTASALVSREHQVGTRPIGFVMGNGSTGYMVEAPESIDYDTSNIKLTTEFGRKHWDASLGYQGSFFQNNTPSMVVTNPFSTVYNSTSLGPATGRMDLYPNNDYQQFVAQGAAHIGKHVSLMANVTPGFLHQNQAFQPLTTNTSVNLTVPAGYPAYVPKSSLNGQVDTLAMNYTAVLKATKDLKFVAKYQHYTWDNNTPDMLVRPVIADTDFMSFRGSPGAWIDPVIGPSSSASVITGATYYLGTEYASFTNRLFDIGGTWFFTKHNSVKFGYQRGWTDRTNREVEESIEDSLYGALDMRLQKHLTLRVAGRHQNRLPQDYELESGDYWHRMVDQAARVRNRGDISLSWDPTDRLSISPFFGTLQDNYNQRGGFNSTLPLGDATVSPLLPGAPLTKPNPIYGPYYAYGVLNSIGRNYGVDVNYALTSKVTLFAEYAREKNTGVAVEGRGFDPSYPCTRTSIPVTLRDAVVLSGSSKDQVTPGVAYSGDANALYPFGTAPRNCDPINDLLNASKDVVNSYFAGVDFTFKKVDLSLFYSLSAGQSFLFADGVNCQVGSNGPNTACALSFANYRLDGETGATKVTGAASRVTATGQAAAADLTKVATNSVTGAATYWAYGLPGAGGFGFPQLVNRVHDVGATVRFKLTDKLVPKFQYIYRQNDYKDWQTQVNPYNFIGGAYSFASATTDPSGSSALQKMLWLGADNPSYRAHIFSATLEYHF